MYRKSIYNNYDSILSLKAMPSSYDNRSNQYEEDSLFDKQINHGELLKKKQKSVGN